MSFEESKSPRPFDRLLGRFLWHRKRFGAILFVAGGWLLVVTVPPGAAQSLTPNSVGQLPPLPSSPSPIQSPSGTSNPIQSGLDDLDALLNESRTDATDTTGDAVVSPPSRLDLGNIEPRQPGNLPAAQAAPLPPATDPLRPASPAETLRTDSPAGPMAELAAQELIQPASYNATPPSQDGRPQDGMRDGVIRNRQEADSLLPPNARSDMNQASVETPAKPLNVIEQQYGQWLRQVLTSSEVEGNFVEVHQVVQQVPVNQQPEVLAAYWRLAEAILRLEIRKQGREAWSQTVGQAGQHPLLGTVSRSIENEIRSAESQWQQARKQWSERVRPYGLPNSARPADAPFAGPYATRLDQVSQSGERLSVWAAEIDTYWKTINSSVADFEWSDSQWQSSRGGSAEQMASAFQLRQRTLEQLVERFCEYNQTIARYSLTAAGYGNSVEGRVAMLLRQPVVDGVVMDIRTDERFQNRSLANWGQSGTGIAHVNYQYPVQSTHPVWGTIVRSDQQAGTPIYPAGYSGNPYSQVSGIQQVAGDIGSQQAHAGYQYRPPVIMGQSLPNGRSNVVPSHAGAWQAARNASPSYR